MAYFLLIFDENIIDGIETIKSLPDIEIVEELLALTIVLLFSI